MAAFRRRAGALVLLAGLIAPVAISQAGTTGPVIVAVRATPAEATRLERTGFDLVEMRDGPEVHVVLWPGDADRLRAAGFGWRVIGPMAAPGPIASPDAEVRVPSTEPSRTTYRTLDDHHAELRSLVAAAPELVELLDLGRSLEGRPILGVRIAIGDAGDGRPHVYLDGIHHAREWPAGEYVLGFAHRLVSDALAGDARVTSLLSRSAVLLVPIVNPDGFTLSRGAPIDGEPGVFGRAGLGAYWRKNVRGVINDDQRGMSVGAYGVDPNRNYPFGWGTGTLTGGRGASGNPADQTYEGPAPSSEPEVSAVRRFVLRNNITALITNHTYGNLVLYPWGHTAQPSPDADVFVPLAKWLAAANRYEPQAGVELYATTGTMDDWAYAATGTLGFTFEHGTRFHPTYGVVQLGRAWNEEAFLRLVEAGADPSKHAVLRGRIVDAHGDGVAAQLELTKTADLPLFQGTFPERIALELETDADGSFAWHLNPSTGPVDTDDYELTITTPAGTETRTVRLARGQLLDLGALPID